MEKTRYVVIKYRNKKEFHMAVKKIKNYLGINYYSLAAAEPYCDVENTCLYAHNVGHTTIFSYNYKKIIRDLVEANHRYDYTELKIYPTIKLNKYLTNKIVW